MSANIEKLYGTVRDKFESNFSHSEARDNFSNVVDGVMEIVNSETNYNLNYSEVYDIIDEIVDSGENQKDLCKEMGIVCGKLYSIGGSIYEVVDITYDEIQCVDMDYGKTYLKIDDIYSDWEKGLEIFEVKQRFLNNDQIVVNKYLLESALNGNEEAIKRLSS